MALVVNLEQINSCSKVEIQAAFLRCCGATRWAELLAASRPFGSEQNLFDASERIWQTLDRDDWIEAFAAHPKIGDLDAARAKFADTKDWSAGEQAGLAGAPDALLLALAQGNRLYEAKFGYIFLVCATGKTAGEMLAMLQQRLKNDPEKELLIAAGEQAKITRLRLQKLCS
jgi:2-oxo-4-hydroxy-4-carboxy-5-ureidoimidazoline decarboxylase